MSASVLRFARSSTPRGHVLMLHGGRVSSDEPVHWWNASWLRMALLAVSMHRHARRAGLTVDLLKHSVHGWNGGVMPSPLPEARDAIADLARDGLPIVLVGHSMGGRTGARVADHPAVIGLVALAPWFPEHEPVDALRGRRLAVLHGEADLICSPERSRDFVEEAAGAGVDAHWSGLPDAGHFMLRSVRIWNRFVGDSTARMIRSHEERGSE